MALSRDERQKAFQEDFQRQVTAATEHIEGLLDKSYVGKPVSIAVEGIKKAIHVEDLYPHTIDEIVLFYKRLGYDKTRYAPGRETRDSDFLIIE